MAPILINQSDFGKIGLIIVLVLVFTFTGGYLIGQQQASLFFEDDQSNDLLPLSEQSRASITELKNSSADDAAISITTTSGSTASDSTVNATTAEAVDVDTENSSELEVDPVFSSTTLKVDPKVGPETAVVAKASAVTEASQSSNSAMLKDEAEIKFSIQVAVYGSLKNAEKMMKKLQKKHLDAYVSDYVSKQNHVRFNVRFGYFNDKESAMNALQDYSDNQQGDGYLVNYSADNIVKFAHEVSADEAPVLPKNAV